MSQEVFFFVEFVPLICDILMLLRVHFFHKIQQFFISFINNTSRFDPLYGPSSGIQYIFKTKFVYNFFFRICELTDFKVLF
jgi:hypothetical protein